MTECKIISHLVTVSEGSAMPSLNGIYGTRAETRCETHGYRFEPTQMLTATMRCPVGMIEATVEAGLSRIESKLAEIEQRRP